ncbi:PREDICTED: LOC18788640 [Prunus dulcis]|uniref:PREDICTED: LOC18788640 n=1 Tax=Prunus dulcis TaxID=3755 RepID=A0A5E4GAR4_PRUDU|nr:PREDICTED: LOC18788640 [Prunus dulcis]
MTTSSHTSNGDTKILVDHNIKRSVFASKLTSLCDTPNAVVYCKYQPPWRTSRCPQPRHQRQGPRPHDDQKNGSRAIGAGGVIRDSFGACLVALLSI